MGLSAAKPWAALALALVLAGSAGAQAWTEAQDTEVRGMIRDGGFFLALHKVVRGQALPATLKPWVDRINEGSLVGTTVRDALVTLPAADDPWLLPLVKEVPAGSEKDWILGRRADSSRLPVGKFHLSLYPVRMDLLPRVSMILPNFDWSVSFQDDHQMTVQALEKGYSATLHLRWIDPTDTDIFDTARLVQMYAGFRPLYMVKKPQDGAAGEGDLVPLPEAAPKALAGRPGILEQVQVGAPDAWQLYAGRTRWYGGSGKVLVVLISVHIDRNLNLADLDRALAKEGLLLDTLRIDG